MQNGNDATRTMTSLSPSRSTAMISWVPQSENHRRSSCQRGDSPNAMPVIRVCSSVTHLLLSLGNQGATRRYGTHAGDVRDDLSDPDTRHLPTFNPPSLRHTPIMTAMRRSFTSQSPAWMAANVRCLSHNLLQDLGYLARCLSSWSAPAIG